MALRGLFLHSLDDLFGEVVDVVLVHQHLEAVNQLLMLITEPKVVDAILRSLSHGAGRGRWGWDFRGRSEGRGLQSSMHDDSHAASPPAAISGG